jgi:hypothetical protein
MGLKLGSLNEPPLCACGCGGFVLKSKKNPGKWNEFISGHNSRIKERTSGQFTKGKQVWKLRKESKANSGSFKKGCAPINYKGGKAICDGRISIAT